jgi:hypothetical protein
MAAGTPRTQVSTLYSPSMDRDLEHRLANFLDQRGVPGRDSLRLEARGGVVAVMGEPPTPYAKWLCLGCCRRVAGGIKIIDKMKVKSATSELPSAVHLAAELDSRTRNRRHPPDFRSDPPRHHIRATEHATPGTVAASQQSKLLAAA